MTMNADPRVIRQSVLGTEMSDEECRTLAGIMQVLDVEDGTTLANEGDVNNHLHLLAEGRIRAESRLEGMLEVLYEMRIGEVAGTRAFVDGTPRRTSLRAFGQATVYALAPAELEALVESHPRLAYKAMRAIFRMTYINLTRVDEESEQLKNYFFKAHGRY